jgi:adenylate cyclase
MEPTPQEIRNQLDRILLSQDFQASERLADFLRFVIEETLAGRGDQINQQTVGIKGLGYAANFDPQTNPSVRIQARRMRRALEGYYFTQGTEDPLLIEIPKGGYVPVFTPNQGANQRPSAPQTSKIKPEPIESGQNLQEVPSIAILPFEYLGNGDEHAFLASGITEELVIALTRFPDLKVIGPLKRNILEESNLGPRGIGQAYAVRFILDGTVRLRAGSLRITAKLTDTLNGHQLWGQTHDYDLETSSIQQIDDDVVGLVAATIADSYGVIPRAMMKESIAQRGDSLSDYEAILRFYHSFYVLTEQAHSEAFHALQDTLERNPENATAAGMLGDLIASIYQYGYDDDEGLVDQSEELARKAIALDPNCQSTRFTMALVHFLRGQRAQFIAEAEKCIQLNPNHALNSAGMGLHLYMAGERERGVALMDKVKRLNPHHPGWYHLVPYMEAYREGDYEAALIEANRFNIPAFHFDPLIRAAVLGQLDRQEEAQEVIDELLALVPDFETRGRSLIQRFAYLDEHVNMIWDGLRKAGFENISNR